MNNIKTTKSIVIFLSTILPMFNFSQIVLDTGDLPEIGDMQISVKVDSAQGAALQPGSAGDNLIWNFSNLIPCCGNVEKSYDTLLWENHIITPNASSFPASDIVWKNKCTTTHSHVTHLDETSCSYEHYFRNGSGLWYYGTENPSNTVFEPVWNVFPLLSYGDTMVTAARMVFPLAPDTILTRNILTTAVCDAWGILITPDTSAESVRIYSAETVIDSLFAGNALQQNSTVTGNYYYRWYIKELGYPLLEINKGLLNQASSDVQEVRYATKTGNIPSIIAEQESAESPEVLLTPNPFSNGLFLNGASENYIISLRIYDINGKMIVNLNNTGKARVMIPTSHFLQGNYFYKIVNGNNHNVHGTLLKQEHF